MRLLPVPLPVMPAIVLSCVGAASLLTYGMMSTALLQYPKAYAQGPESAPLRAAMQQATPQVTPESHRLFPEVPPLEPSASVPPPQEAPRETSRTTPLLFFGSAVVMGLNSFFPFVSAPSSIIRIVRMSLPATLWGAAWWLTSPGWKPGFVTLAPLLDSIVFQLELGNTISEGGVNGHLLILS